MPHPYDASSRTLFNKHAADWVRFSGETVDGPVRVLDTDASLVGGARDTLLLIEGLRRRLVQFELQANFDLKFPDRLLRYSIIATEQHGFDVESIGVLLRPEADGSHLTGRLTRSNRNGPYLEFRYRIIRVWEVPVDAILSGGLGTLALAPLAGGASERLPDVLQEVSRRCADELPGSDAIDLLTITGVLMGLRHPPELCRKFLRGVRQMKELMRESVVYQDILQEGRQEGRDAGVSEGIAAMHRMLLAMGAERFGEPTPAVEKKLHSINSLERLQELGERLMRCKSWEELFSRRRPGGRRGS